MMGQPKPFASLSSGLLARKGQARPAMRPQGFAGFGTLAEAIDDLGWNDMGTSETPGPVSPAIPAQVLPITPAVTNSGEHEAMPPVLREREILHEEFVAPNDAVDYDAPTEVAPTEPAPVLEQIFQSKRRKADGTVDDVDADKSPAVAAKVAAKGKAAFTLRLDNDRHFRLRLASALRHQSAQMLVTEALDAFLQSIPEIEAMAARVVGHGTDNA